MSFQEIAKRVRAEAGALGIRLPMAKLNDAIAVACYGKKYAAVVAAERAGQLPALPFPPPHIAAAARQYRVGEHALGLSLHTGIEGAPTSRLDGTVDLAMEWLTTKHPAALRRLERTELFGLADEQLVQRVLSNTSFQTMGFYGFSEWAIAEGTIPLGKRLEKISDLLLTSKSRPAWNSRQRAYIAALAATPLRLYLIESVVAGYSMTLRPIGGDGTLIQVAERSGSRPEIQGCLIGGRIIQHNDRLELAGGIFIFNRFAGNRLVDTVRQASSTAEVSRAIRAAWFDQFGQPAPTVRLAGSGEAVRLVTDHYQCEEVTALETKLAGAPEVDGNVDLGWSFEEVGEDGRCYSLCSITVDDEVPNRIQVFYQSEARAERLKTWFETLCGPSVTFLERESIDPMEVALDAREERLIREEIRIAPDTKSELLTQAFQQIYADWADKPIQMLDNHTPRELLAKPGGEARVREVLALYESNERSMAHNERRPPVSFAFLYQQIGLTEAERVVSKSQGLHPDQFEVNEAWVVFKLLDTPAMTADKDRYDPVGLMDAGSTAILNFTLLPHGADFSELEATGFMTRLKVPGPRPRPPRHLLIASNVAAQGLETVARRLGISTRQMDEQELMPIIGPARDSMGDHLDALIG